MTPQGRAIRRASVRFGNGRTLPFTPCKKGFVPYVPGHTTPFKYACPLHDCGRRQRVRREGGGFRQGEVDVVRLFWARHPETAPAVSSPPPHTEEEATEGKHAAVREKGTAVVHASALGN
jgi:hypothetical protein